MLYIYIYALGEASAFTAQSDMRRTAPLVKPRVTDDGIWRRQVLSLLHHSLYLRTLLILLALRVQRTNTLEGSGAARSSGSFIH